MVTKLCVLDERIENNTLEHFGDCVDLVRLLQWITLCNRFLQKAFNMKFHGQHRPELLQCG
ncbi:hypothetical protein Ddye_007035 [Dipteronia dyeriana]|uniref:Uncharacterized protein n=1 Tax=Dipteronia dyeriana TaxID=168575 RepID=A0AAD9XJI0_9ROSI|nr:hypothetical protein Ddye_007035 [Dipteronia dyeriana]